MGRYIPDGRPFFEAKTKEAELEAEERRLPGLLARLEKIEVNAETRALLQRFTQGDLTIEELNTALDRLEASRSILEGTADGGGEGR